MTREIQLTRGRVAIVDDEDYERLSVFKWFCTPGSSGLFYAKRITSVPVNGKRRGIRMHREIVAATPDIDVDHIDGNGLNNVRSNLRLATKAENSRNRGLFHSNKYGLKGISLSKDRWRARIVAHGIVHELGRFDSPEKAHEAYAEASARLHGEFGRTQ